MNRTVKVCPGLIAGVAPAFGLLSKDAGSAPVPGPVAGQAASVHRVTVCGAPPWFVQVTSVPAGTVTTSGLKKKSPMATFCVAADDVPTRETTVTAKATPTVQILRLTTAYLRYVVPLRLTRRETI